AGRQDRRDGAGDGGDDAGDVVPGGLAPVERGDAAHHGGEEQPPSVAARLLGLGLMPLGDGRLVHHMCAMPANSFPRSSPGWAFAATQTRKRPGVDSIMARDFFGTMAQPFARYMWPRRATIIPCPSRIVAPSRCF